MSLFFVLESTANFNVTLNFSDCERTCAILPNTKEEFYITLQRNGDLDDSIILSPVNGVIVISGNNNIVSTVIRVSYCINQAYAAI